MMAEPEVWITCPECKGSGVAAVSYTGTTPYGCGRCATKGRVRLLFDEMVERMLVANEDAFILNLRDYMANLLYAALGRDYG